MVASCNEVADHVYALIEPKNHRARAIRDTFERRCDGDRWSERARSCIAEEPALDARRGCRESTLTATQRKQLDGALAAITTTPATTVRDQAVEACPVVAVQECAEYCDALVMLANCQRMPPSARDMVRQMWMQQMVAWSALPIDAQRKVCAQQLVMLQHSAGCGP
jgi:hypothetical protein